MIGLKCTEKKDTPNFILFKYKYNVYNYVSCMYLVYILKSKCCEKTYVGMTNDFFHRLRQHNGEIKGGAKYTTNIKIGILSLSLMDFIPSTKHANANGV